MNPWAAPMCLNLVQILSDIHIKYLIFQELIYPLLKSRLKSNKYHESMIWDQYFNYILG